VEEEKRGCEETFAACVYLVVAQSVIANTNTPAKDG